MQVGDRVIIDEEVASAIRERNFGEVTGERAWKLKIYQLDLETCTGRARLVSGATGSKNRFRIVITDPAFEVAGNSYLKAFAEQAEILVTGKATVRDGEIPTLYVSNTTS